MRIPSRAGTTHIRILDINANQFRGKDSEHYIKTRMLSPDLGGFKRNKIKKEGRYNIIGRNNYSSAPTNRLFADFILR